MAKDDRELAKRYARALLEVLFEMEGEEGTDLAERQLSELAVLAEGEVGAFFGNPVFGMDEKITVLNKLLEKHPIDRALKRFLDVLVSARVVDQLPEIAIQFAEANRERRNQVVAKLKTAFPIGDPELDRIRKALGKITGKTVSLDVTVEKSLIGGAVAEVGGVIYDASIRNYLRRMQEEL